ncbi:hypothetical protein ACJJTC_011963 [Scirpophaga incertulas]
MADIDEIIDYIKTLKKGFDKDIFQGKIDELAHIVDTLSLDYDDFHTLFKVWLNLSIPITKWVTLGACLIPPKIIEEKTVDYSLRWILANYENHSNFTRIGFLLDWLTVAMDFDCIDMTALDTGYELFYVMLSFEVLTAHAVKLVYTLTKPKDVTRRRVLELLDYIKKREAKKNICRQLQVLLGLFKSYKPECVPEDIPAISIHTAFKKVNVQLLTRFKNLQEHQNNFNKETHYLTWMNPMNSERRGNKKHDPLIPNMQFPNIGSKQYADREPKKNYLDFSDAVSLLQYSIQHTMTRPARLRALLCNETGLVLLSVASDLEHNFFSHDLYHLLTNCFLDGSPHSYIEKQDLLQRLVILQRTLMQGLPVISSFLAQYLPLWNEKDYFPEILDLVEWIHIDNANQVQCIVDSLTRMYHRSQPLEQCAILNSLTNMYTNLVDISTKGHRHFMSFQHVEADYTEVLHYIAQKITRMSNTALQVNPEDMRVVLSSITGAVRMSEAEMRVGGKYGASVVGRLVLAAALIGISPVALELSAGLLLTYRNIFSTMKAANMLKNDQKYKEQIHTLTRYTCDLVSCLCSDVALRSRNSGLVFNRLQPQLVGKLYSLMSDVDTKLSIRNHIGFAPYTYLQLEAIDQYDADNKFWLEAVVDQEFPKLSNFLKEAML